MATLEKKKQTSALTTGKKQIILLENEQLVNDAVNALRLEGGRLLHQMGRILVVDLGNFEQKIRAALPKGAKLTTVDALDDKILNKSELLPLRALRKRERPNFRGFKAKKQDEKKEWDDIGLACETGVTTTTRDIDEVELPSRERMINKNAVAVVIVDGIQPDRKITEDERDNIIAELQEATEWISDSRPNANISWALKVFEAAVDLVPWEGVPWPGMPDAYYDGFDAIVTNSKNGRIYAFRGGDYIRFTNVSNGMDSGFPKSIASNWNGLPDAFEASIDAALWRQSNEKIYLFKGAQYVRVDPTTFTVDANYPKPLAGNWNGLPADFQAGIDAALGHKKNNSIYMFKGDKYVKFSNGSSTMDAGYPKTISSNWHGLPDNFKEGIDAAFWRDSNERIYLFKNNRWGGKYVRLNPDNFTVEAGYEDGKNVGLSGEEAELQMDELTQITEYIQGQAGDEAEVIFGHGVDSLLGDRIRVTVIATGFIPEGKIAKKTDEKKIHELDRSQISLFDGADNSVNQRNAELELRLRDEVIKPAETPQRPAEKPILNEPETKPFKKEEEQTEKRPYEFIVFKKEEHVSNHRDDDDEESEDQLFRKEDEFGIVKELSADQVIDQEGMMEYRKTKERLEQQAKDRRERMKSSKKQEMTKEEFTEKWTLPAYLRRGVKMENAPHSSESFISRYNLNDDNNLLGNNKFLHDNVD